MIENRHRLDFADTMRRAPVACLGVRLKPYSIGHELELLRLRNPFVLLNSFAEIMQLPGNRLGDALAEAVDVCSQSHTEYTEAERLMAAPVPPWRWRDFTAKMRVRYNFDRWQKIVRRCDLKKETHRFIEYLTAEKSGPEYADMAGENTVAIGAPEMAILIQYVRSLPAPLVALHGVELDYPIALARYEFSTINEQAGKVRLQPDNNQSFSDWCAEQEALIKTGEIKIPAVAPIKE